MSDSDKTRLLAALEAKTAAREELRAAIRAASAPDNPDRASIRELAALLGVSPDTIVRWKRAD